MNEEIVNNLCRLCATQDLDLNLLENDFTKGTSNRKKLLSLVSKYLKIKVLDDQFLPKKFCFDCVKKLNTFDSFNKKCHEVQSMFTSISSGHPLSENHRQVLEKCNFLNKVDLSLSNNSDISQESLEPNRENDFDNDSDFTWSDNLGNDDSFDNDLDDIPLALRSKKKVKFSMDSKCKRGRPKKSFPRVPPLRIKAIKSDNSKSLEDIVLDELTDTKYEIRDDSEVSKDVLESNLKSEPRNDVNDNNESDDGIILHDSLSTEDKESSTNPFALFEFRCNVCQELFDNFNTLKKHCKKEHSSSAFVNCVCGKQLRARTAIIEHRRKHTGTSLYKCDTCSKTFNRRSLLCLHKISHMPKDEQPFVCCKCAKRFHTSSLLKKHEKVHLPEEERFLDECNICQKKFTSKSAVNAHLRAVHYGEKPFVCEHCGNSFSSKAILTDHLTTHSSYAPWPCDICGRNFKSKYRLNVHMDMHRSVKYRCPHCPMELSTRRTLRMHLLVHKDEKAYVCKECSKAFRRSKDLKNHSNLHTGRRPYKCEFCSRTFANGSNCRAHKLRMHPTELGVEKNSRSSSKQPKSEPVVNPESDRSVVEQSVPTSSVITSITAKNSAKEYPNYEPNKYEFPTTCHQTDFSMEYPRYVNAMSWNMKKPQFAQQPIVNHFGQFTSDMHSDVAKVHNFLSYS